MVEKGDPFRDLTFSGAPSDYRLFRRKILLNVASLEEKHVKLAGPKILTRLTGEAWRATEHLSISELRSEDGWLLVLRALDNHYKYLPETELNECVDEFLFHLKRRSGEGPTAFVSRFKSVLSRLETLIAAEKRGSAKRKRERQSGQASTGSESNDTSGGSEEPRLTKEHVERAATEGDKAAQASDSKGPKTVGSFVGERSPKRGPPSSGGSQRSRGTHKADDDKAQRKMLESLGRLEVGHLKLKPVFPEVILGHLFMRKYGLNREQRSQVIRSTGGSCKFRDIEKVIRASDYEDRHDAVPRNTQHRSGRPSGAVMAAAEESSLSEPSMSDPAGDALAAETYEDSEDEELEEAFEVHKKARNDAKRAFKTYKDSRRRVRELKKERQPYMPVVALPAGTAQPSDTMPLQPTFRYDRKEGKKGDRGKGARKGRKEEVSMVHADIVTEFAYMVEGSEGDLSEYEVLSASIPKGMAVIDTGCTTSVVGQETASVYSALWKERGLPDPVQISLPPVQLRGFNGVKSTSEVGMQWTVRLGCLWGQVTTYVVPGKAPFLLSRKVLEGMQARLDLGKLTITSDKHGLDQTPLAQASNGHLLISLLPDTHPEASFPARTKAVAFADHPEGSSDSEAVDQNPRDSKADNPSPPVASVKPRKTTHSDLKRHFQTIMKHTRYTTVDVGTHRYPLRMLFGSDVDFALCAYRPRYERTPKQAASKDLYGAVAHLTPKGELLVSAWNPRPANARRAEYDRPGACIFAYRCDPADVPESQPPVSQNLGNVSEETSVVPPELSPGKPSRSVCAEAGTTMPSSGQCDCCEPEPSEDEATPATQESPNTQQSLEALYDEVDWVSLSHLPVPSSSRGRIARQVEAVRRVPFQLALATLKEQPQLVEQELREWLGSQGSKLAEQVGLVEVFADAAPLSKQSERRRGLTSIRLGSEYGQDFSRARDRRLLLLLLGRCRPKDVWFSWPSGCWSNWSQGVVANGGPGAEEILGKRRQGKPLLSLFEQVWSLQTLQGGHLHAENPIGSAAWKELNLGPAFEVDFHMCAVDLKCPKTHLPVKKPTRIVTSDPGLVSALSRCKCPGHAEHAHLTAARRNSFSGIYPRKFCAVVTACMSRRDKQVNPQHDIFIETDDEADSERESEPDAEAPEEGGAPRPKSYKAMVQKLHVNTGHASIPQMLRLAQRSRAPARVIEEIRNFRCPVCEELQVPPSHRTAALTHTETPNHIVGLDVVQVELKKDGVGGLEEQKFQVLTVVDYASDFAQQIVLPPGPRSVSRAFHSVWCRPYGPPRIIYVDPDQRWMSEEFQTYLKCNSITLLDTATESHWQLGRVEVAQKILRLMAQRVWRTSDRPPAEVIESCSSVRNEQLKRHGFSSAQWFLGREPRVPGSLSDITERQNLAVQDAVHSEQDFAQKMQVRQQAAEAFLQAHAHNTWSRAIRGRNRPIRGPYVVGQSVYVFRKQGKGQFATRHGSWLGPGRVVGTESFREDSPVPRVIWVVVNGFMYKCSPECLRPVVEDEVVFKQLAQEFYAGHLPDELEQATPARRGPAGRFFDLTANPPTDADFLTPPASDEEGDASPGADRNVRRRITLGDEYWQARAEGTSPRGAQRVREREDLQEEVEAPSPKVARHEPPGNPDLEEYSPSLPPAEPQPDHFEPHLADADMSHLPPVPDIPGDLSETETLPDAENLCCEIAFDIFAADVCESPGCLWEILDECAVTAARPGQKRRVEVSFRKLGEEDRARFKGAMRKEWQSWLENKVTTIVKSQGLPKSRIIGSRWVLTWKKSSDPDDRSLSPKARLVLVGFQDPDLGRIATDSPTLRKESKHIILSICASKGWVIWGADIKTAFLSGDASNRDLYFRPPPEVKEFMQLTDDDVLRLEKAAYGLAEAPRAWFLRLTRELVAVGLVVSQLDPCVFLLRDKLSRELLGVCGVHVDDLLGGGTPAMDECLQRLRKKLPFGDFRRTTIKYTGAEIRQLPDKSIEVSQEAYISKMEEVCTKPFGKASNPLPEPTLMRACCGQLAWVANHSRPEQSFLASYLQGTQDRAEVAHLELYNKAVRELKARKVTLKFPPVPLERWRLLVITDAGWGVRANGESQGGLALCLCDQDVLDRKPGRTWLIEWSSKKLRRVVRSSTAAETMAAQNGLDAIEFAQAFLQEVLYGMTPRVFQQWVPDQPSGLVIDSKSLYDALTRSACSSALAMEKRLAIDYAIARACLSERHVLPYWTNNLQMVADCLTKLKGNKDTMFKLLDTCMYHAKPSKESGRKEAARTGGTRAPSSAQ